MGCDLRSWSFPLLYCSIENATIYWFFNSVLFLVTLQDIYQSCTPIALFSVRLSFYNRVYLLKSSTLLSFAAHTTTCNLLLGFNPSPSCVARPGAGLKIKLARSDLHVLSGFHQLAQSSTWIWVWAGSACLWIIFYSMPGKTVMMQYLTPLTSQKKCLIPLSTGSSTTIPSVLWRGGAGLVAGTVLFHSLWESLQLCPIKQWIYWFFTC